MSARAFAPGKPTDMVSPVWERIARLPPDTRDRVLERAAIKIADGTPPHVADQEALAEETGVGVQQSLGGV